MMRVINSGVVSSLPCAITNGEVLTARSKPIERRIKLALHRTFFSPEDESKTFLRNQMLPKDSSSLFHCDGVEGLCVSNSWWLHFCSLA